jgi:hypothetical protein
VLTRLLRAEIAAICAIGVGSLAFAVAGRMFFPWPLEWMEGATLAHVARILQGRAIYAAPTAEFVPYLYPPLSYLPMAASVLALGETLPAARLPSILSTIGTLWLLGRAASHAGGGRLGALLAAGLWGLGYGYGGAFHDLARVDAFFLLLVAGGTERLLADRPRSALALFALSFFAKQHGLLFLVAASIWLAMRDLRRHLPGLVGAWGGAIFLVFALHLDSGGWFGRYVFSLPRSHGVLWRLVPAYLAIDVLLALPAMAIAAIASAVRSARQPRAIDVLLAAGLAASALGRAHIGGFDNVLLPAYAMLCVAAAAPLAGLLGTERHRPAVRAAAGAALLVQALVLFQPPAVHWPAPDAAARFRALARTARACAGGGEWAALDHAGLGGRPFLHTMALSDLREAGDTPLARAGTRALVRGLRGPDAPAAVVVGARFPALDEALARGYRLCAAAPAPPMATGYPVPDAVVYTRAR